MKRFSVFAFLFILAVSGWSAGAAEKITVLIVDGQNNHDWEKTTPFLEKQLEDTGRFTVDVSTSPAPDGTQAEWDAWRPDFAAYDVVVSNYNNQRNKAKEWSAWPEAVQKSFEEYMKNGGGLVNVHAANNAHAGWTEFEKMTGLLWRKETDGKRLYLNAEGKPVTVAVGEGPASGHGPRYPYVVKVWSQEHPVTQGMPEEWMHPEDELYHGQRGPALDMTVLATAFSAEDQKGTGANEPMLWFIPYGEGRAVTCLLGHVGKTDETNMIAMRCVGFLTILKRSCEWAAGEEVTFPIPANFPTKDAISVIEVE